MLPWLDCKLDFLKRKEDEEQQLAHSLDCDGYFSEL